MPNQTNGPFGQRQGGNNQQYPDRERRNSDNDDEIKQRKCGLCKQTGAYRIRRIQKIKSDVDASQLFRSYTTELSLAESLN